MATANKTRDGWILEITHTRHGCLEQGGRVGRRELYSRRDIEALGIDFDADPEAFFAPGVTNWQALRYRATPTVLDEGQGIA